MVGGGNLVDMVSVVDVVDVVGVVDVLQLSSLSVLSPLSLLSVLSSVTQLIGYSDSRIPVSFRVARRLAMSRNSGVNLAG